MASLKDEFRDGFQEKTKLCNSDLTIECEKNESECEAEENTSDDSEDKENCISKLYNNCIRGEISGAFFFDREKEMLVSIGNQINILGNLTDLVDEPDYEIKDKSETENSGNTEEDFEDVKYKNLSGNHTDEQVHKYQIGEKTLFRKFKLNQYREKKNICEFCGKSFSFSGSLKRHLQTHAREKSYKCEICQKSFTKCLRLINHVKIHTGEIKRKPKKKYACEICQKSFTQGNLKKHMKIHTGEKKHECKICGKTFSRNGNLKTHLVSHTGEKPFECRICGKTFSQKAYLRTHLVIHTGEKKYKCKICQNTFSQGAHLRAHLVTHTGEKKYQCEICGKAVSSNTELNRHLLIHTGVKNNNVKFVKKHS